MTDHTGLIAVLKGFDGTHREAIGYLDAAADALEAQALEIEALRADAERHRWLPIDGAPKDGSLFLCWVEAVRYGECAERGQYEQDVSEASFAAWRQPSADGGDGYVDAFCGQIGDWQHITHWMPLPPPPAIDAAMSAEKGVAS